MLRNFQKASSKHQVRVLDSEAGGHSLTPPNPLDSTNFMFIVRNPGYVFRAVSTTAVRAKQTPLSPLIKNYPVTLRLVYPFWDYPLKIEFSSEQDITNFLDEKFLILQGKVILPDQVAKIDPDKTYEVAGPDLPYREKGLSRDQAWDIDRVFERKTALALKEALQKEDPYVVELPRIIKGSDRNDVKEWEGVYQLSDGTIVFLETKFRMSKAHIDQQMVRMSKSLRAMEKWSILTLLGLRPSQTRLYLAGYHWPKDEDCISYASNMGYGIIRPNGPELTVAVKAEVLHLK